jgi:transposase
MPSCLIDMDACVGAHHLSRRLKALGHDARLMPAKYVRPYSKGQKNDFRDAEAIAEAVQRPTMRFVATKTADQLNLQALHRVRERLVHVIVMRRTEGSQPCAGRRPSTPRPRQSSATGAWRQTSRCPHISRYQRSK